MTRIIQYLQFGLSERSIESYVPIPDHDAIPTVEERSLVLVALTSWGVPH